MATEDCKLTIEEREVLKIRYYKYIDKDNSFWNNLIRKYRYCESKRVTNEWITIVKSWLFDCPYKYKVVRDSIHFGDYEKDGWCYYYNWVKGQFGVIVRQLLDDEETKQRKQQTAKQKEKKDRKKCQQWGLNYEDIGCNFKHKTLENVRIRWTGINDRGRKFPIEFYSYEEKKNKIMKLDYFKNMYIKEIENGK